MMEEEDEEEEKEDDTPDSIQAFTQQISADDRDSLRKT